MIKQEEELKLGTL